MKKAIILVAALTAVLALGGCGASNTPAQNSSSGESANNASSSSSSSSTSNESSASKDSKASSSSASSADSKAKSEKSEKKSSDSSASKEKAKEGSPLSKSEAKAIIESNGYGEVVDMKESKYDDGKWYWEVSASVDDGSVHEYLVDPKGTVISADKESGTSSNAGSTTKTNKLDEDDIEQVIFKQGLGQIVSSKKVTLDDGVQYWQVVTRDSDGSKATFMIDPNGNVSEK